MSWDYCFVSDTELIDLKEIYSFFRKWKGNSNSRKTGHCGMSLGDIIVLENECWIVVGTGFQKVPETLYKKINFK